MDGLERLAKRSAALCGTYVYEGSSGWNLQHLKERFGGQAIVAFTWAKRRQGLILPADSQIQEVVDLAGKKVTLRQASAGSHILFEHLVAQAGLTPDAFETVG